MTQVIHNLRDARAGPKFKHGRSRTFKLGLGFSGLAGLADAVLIVALALSAGAAYHLFAYDEVGVIINYARVGALVALAFVVPQALQGQYAASEIAKRLFPAARIFALWNAAFFALLAIAFLAKASGVYSRGAVILFYGLGLAGVTALRAGLAYTIARGFAHGRLISRRVLLVGTEAEVTAFRKRYSPQTHGLQIAGVALLPRAKPCSDKARGRFESALDRAVCQARKLQADDVFLLLPWGESDAITACADAFLATPASINLGPARVLERYRELHVWRVGGAAGLTLARPPLSAFEQLAKRGLDLVCASIGLIVLSPLLAVIAAAIKFESTGPVLFRQRRAGFNQETFRILKFRTMACQEDGDTVRQAQANDPRFTRLGRFLRAWNLDELPQLWNVIQGQMSIVGPRPHALVHDHEFEQRIARYAWRHNVKPGITGWAQVQGHRGPTETDAKIRARVEHDLYYIDNWSIWFDIQIMALTIFTGRAFMNAH